MATMNISLPDELRAFVDRRVSAQHYTSASEYLRELIRRERDIELLREQVLAGRDSGPPREIDAAWFEQLRAQAAGDPGE
jgi:antitoxin ParD1/3/4